MSGLAQYRSKLHLEGFLFITPSSLLLDYFLLIGVGHDNRRRRDNNLLQIFTRRWTNALFVRPSRTTTESDRVGQIDRVGQQLSVCACKKWTQKGHTCITTPAVSCWENRFQKQIASDTLPSNKLRLYLTAFSCISLGDADLAPMKSSRASNASILLLLCAAP